MRSVLATSPPSVEYSLSPLGQQLLPAIHQIARIGHQLKLQTADKAEEADSVIAAADCTVPAQGQMALSTAAKR
jgi:DNA-binding HxlR family transcriptional regulator